MTREQLKEKSKEEVFDFIRERLKFDWNIEGQLRYTDINVFKKEHRRFEMSGDDAYIEHNFAIVNEFADLGIHDYTYYLFVYFYKGCGTLKMQYIYSEDEIVVPLDGYQTVEIIYEIFERTIFQTPIKPHKI